MSKNNQYSYSKWSKGDDFIKVASHSAKVTRNGGSHVKITTESGDMMIVPDHDLGKGLSHKIWSWFIKVGLLVLIIKVYFLLS